MTINSDLLNTFGRLFQNRQFAFTIQRQSQFLERGNPEAGRGQLRLLQLLREHPEGLSNTDISIMLDIKPSSVSAMVKHLEHHNLIVRIPNEADKRSSLVQISPAGQKQFQDLAKSSDEIAAALFTGLSDSEKVQLTQLLNKIDDNFTELDWSALKSMHHNQHGWHGGMPH